MNKEPYMDQKKSSYPDGLEISKKNGSLFFKSWSFGLYQGKSLQSLQAITDFPILSSSHFIQDSVAFVADPFYIKWSGTHLIYFEMYLWKIRKGVIGVATSDNLLDWEYSSIVLEEPFHLSYPHVFIYDGDLYMLPETIGAGCMRLYKAISYDKFELVHEFIPGIWGDSTLVYYNNLWWLFTCPDPLKNSTLELFYSSNLKNNWFRHPLSPIIAMDKSKARPAGKVFCYNDSLYRFAQDCQISYGRAIRCYKIDCLSTCDYLEHSLSLGDAPILNGQNSEWSFWGNHHIDIIQRDDNGFLCVVDGATLKPLYKSYL